MITITIPGIESWDPINERFISGPSKTVKMEHSLISLSKWESTHKKHFINNKTLTMADLMDYFLCMVVTPSDITIEDIYRLTHEQIVQLYEYQQDRCSATTVSEDPRKPRKRSREIITSEVIYCWMAQLSIPFSCEKWNLNRLLILIDVCNIKNSPSKSMSPKDVMRQNRSLNAARRAKLHSKG